MVNTRQKQGSSNQLILGDLSAKWAQIGFNVTYNLTNVTQKFSQRDVETRKIAVEVGYWGKSAAEAEPVEGGGGFDYEL